MMNPRNLFTLVLTGASLTLGSVAHASTANVDATEATSEDRSKLRDVIDTRVHFGLDEATLPTPERDRLGNIGKFLAEQENLKVTIEGRCDERGTAEYNLALGQRRAEAVRDYLKAYEVDTTRLQVISYGEERPLVQGHDETAWSANRTAGFVPEGKLTGVAAPQAVAAAPAPKPAATPQAARMQKAASQPVASSNRSYAPLIAGLGAMAMAVPVIAGVGAALLGLAYLGPRAWPSPPTGQEPLTLSPGGLQVNSASNPLNGMGPAWSMLLHPEQRAVSAPVVVAALGAGAVAGLAAIALAVGGAALVGYWLNDTRE